MGRKRDQINTTELLYFSFLYTFFLSFYCSSFVFFFLRHLQSLISSLHFRKLKQKLSIKMWQLLFFSVTHRSPFPLFRWFSSFYFLKKRGIPLFLSWHFHALLSQNNAKYSKIARIIN